MFGVWCLRGRWDAGERRCQGGNFLQVPLGASLHEELWVAKVGSLLCLCSFWIRGCDSVVLISCSDTFFVCVMLAI